MKRLDRVVWSLLLASACTSAGAADETAEQSAALDTGAAIGVLDSGQWYEFQCEHTCWRKQSFWVDLDVRDDAYEKQVAIVWTDDDWQTRQVTVAQYEGELANGRERWGVDVPLGYFSGAYAPREVEYAAFVVMAGATHWDAFPNHHIFGRVTREQPVKLIESAVSYEADVGAVLSGTVRVFNLAYQKHVTVAYTTDDWATSAETEATWSHENDWTFRVEGLGGLELPDSVRFAVRYRAADGEHWDNNTGYDYQHRLRPQISISAPWSSPEQPLAGILAISGYQYGDLPIERLDVRVDGEAWRIGDPGLSWRQLELSTLGLVDGEHQVELRAVLKGGYQTSFTHVFHVQNRVSTLGAWDPDFGALEAGSPEARGWSGGMAVDGAGRVYLQWDEPWSIDALPYRGIARFASFGTDLEPMIYERLPESAGGLYSSVERLTVDELGRVYGLQRWPLAIWRWTTAGAIDTSFGEDGRLDFGTAFDGEYLDSIGDLVAGDGSLWVVGRCPSFVAGCRNLVARFDETGTLAGVLHLPPSPEAPYGYGYDAGVATWADGSLWVQALGRLFRVQAGAEGGLDLVDTVVLEERVHAPLQDLVRSPSGSFFALDQSNRLVVFGESGALEASWLLYAQQRLPGSARSPVQLALLADGHIGVLDGESARVVVFEQVAAPLD